MLIFFPTFTHAWKILLFVTFHRAGCPSSTMVMVNQALKKEAELVFFAEESFLMLILASLAGVWDEASTGLASVPLSLIFPDRKYESIM